MTTPAQLKVSRSRELDVLRCLAILLVLCHHAPPAPAEAPALLRWLAGLVAASAVAGRRLGRILFLLDLPLALDGAERGDWPASGKNTSPGGSRCSPISPPPSEPARYLAGPWKFFS